MTFTDMFKVHIVNDAWTDAAIKDRAQEIIDNEYEYPVIELADFLENF